MVAPCQHANKGGRGHALRPFGREPHGQGVGRTGGESLVRRSGLVLPRMEERNPHIGVRVGHPKEWSLDFWDGMLFPVGQHEEPCVRQRGSGTMGIRTVAAARAEWPIEGAVLPLGRQCVLAIGQQRRDFWRG